MVFDADGGGLVEIEDALCRIDAVEVTSLLDCPQLLFLGRHLADLASLVVGCEGREMVVLDGLALVELLSKRVLVFASQRIFLGLLAVFGGKADGLEVRIVRQHCSNNILTIEKSNRTTSLSSYGR